MNVGCEIAVQLLIGRVLYCMCIVVGLSCMELVDECFRDLVEL